MSIKDSRTKFRDLAFALQIASRQRQNKILKEMIKIMKKEEDEYIKRSMDRTICANIVQNNLEANYGIDRYCDSSAMATNSK